MTPGQRVAVYGGDGRFCTDKYPGCAVRVYPGMRYGGHQAMCRLERSLRAGCVDYVVVLARWNAHSATARILRVCRALGVPFVVVP